MKEHKTKYRTTSRRYPDLFTALTRKCILKHLHSTVNALDKAQTCVLFRKCVLEWIAYRLRAKINNLFTELAVCLTFGLSHSTWIISFSPHKFQHLTGATHAETIETEHTCQNNVCILVFKWFNIYLHSHRWRTNKETKGVKAINLTNLNKMRLFRNIYAAQ